MMQLHLLLFPSTILTFFFWFLNPVLASPGDDLYAFTDCVYQCEQITCYNNHYYIEQYERRQELLDQGYELNYYNPTWQFVEMPLPWHLRLLGWTCESNCDYQCTRVITNERKKHEEEIYQFHGKWPFLRVCGVQELMSVLMSLGNLIVNYRYGFRKICPIITDKSLPYSLRKQYLHTFVVVIITMLAWTASAIFHTRDYPVTEHLDYYLAGATILSTFHALGSREFSLHKRENQIYQWAFSTLCISAYVYHVQRLYRDWSYTYNMRANLTLGVFQNIFYCLIVFKLYSRYYYLEQSTKQTNQNHLKYIDFKRILLPSFYSASAKLYALYPLLLCTIVVLGSLLEIFDFPPICYDLVDAHSLWHLVTIIPPYMGWYDWLVWDINENVWPDVLEEEETTGRKKAE
ncbi:hypothetical protein KGF57_002995 [Candida theae]|uniref:Post-GPI attachment to proteins factor 3 n=1 Tax=Candida theae TaxID=1198502 RepID=A0AAD5FY81_9ASCO|nr:uncharacterized protein KGF57_002995 [Candida theae]KAI5957729.1 hypothetical protein KGF57_002995 [Candida theae]